MAVYTTGPHNLCHPNVLAYYASDMISSYRGGCTQLWIITAFHPAGSLYDLLVDDRPLNCHKLALSVATGLAYLHTQVAGGGKPAIAHRDVKTKNILVMANGEGCLADLGLALIGNTTESTAATLTMDFTELLLPPPAGPLAGTNRYMAPEILSLFPLLCVTGCDEKPSADVDARSGTLIPEALADCRHALLPFEVYLAADVYALGLVLLEIWGRHLNLSLRPV